MAMLMTTEVKPLEFPFFFFFLGSSGESFGANEEYLIASELLTFSRLVSEQELGTKLTCTCGGTSTIFGSKGRADVQGFKRAVFHVCFSSFSPQERRSGHLNRTGNNNK